MKESTRKFWEERIPQINNGKLFMLEDGYTFSMNGVDLHQKSSMLGCGGALGIYIIGGRIKISNNMWCCGYLPEEMRDQVTAESPVSINPQGLVNIGLLQKYKVVTHSDTWIPKVLLIKLYKEHITFLSEQSPSTWQCLEDDRQGMIKAMQEAIANLEKSELL